MSAIFRQWPLGTPPAQATASRERITRPENVIYWEESCGRTFNVTFKAMKPRGIKHVKGLAGQNGAGPQMRGTTKAMKQQYKFAVGGDNAAVQAWRWFSVMSLGAAWDR